MMNDAKNHRKPEATRARGLPLTLALFAVVVFFWKVITFQGVLFHFDLIAFNAAVREFFFKHVADGSFPLWCPDICGGFPLFAEGQLGPLYLPNYLIFTLFAPGTSLNISVIVHVALAALGAYFFLARNHRRFSAAIGAVAFTFSSYLVYHLVHLMLFQSACLLPWVFFFFDRYLDRGRWADVLYGGLVLGTMFLTGHQQGPILACLGFGIYALVLALERGAAGRRSEAKRIFMAGILVGLVAVALSTVVIFSMLDLVNHSVRQGASDPSLTYSGSIPPDLLVRLASPAHNGLAGNDTWRLENFLEKETAIYLGLAVFLFVPLAFVGRSRRRDRAHLAVVAFGLAFILGNFGPFDGLLEHVPIINKFRVPARFLLPMTLSLAYLVASGLDRLQAWEPGRKKGVLVVAAGGTVWALLAWGGAWAEYGSDLIAPSKDLAPRMLELLGDLKADLLVRSVTAVLLAAGGVALIFTGPRRRILRTAVLAAIFALVFFDLALLGRSENPVSDKAVYGPFETVDFLNRNLGPYRIYSLDNHVPFSHGGWNKDIGSFRYGVEGLPYTSPLLFGINTASCGSPLMFDRYARIKKSLSVTWLRQMSVRYLLARREIGLPVVLDTGRVKVQQVPEPAPLYSLASHVVDVVGADAAHAAAGRPGADVLGTAFVEGRPAAAPIVGGGTAGGSVQLIQYDPDRRVLHAQADAGAFLVVRESFHPGWRARLNGRPAKIYRANSLFFGLFVPAGESRVVLSFSPPGFRPSLAISLLVGLGVLGAALFVGPLRKTRVVRPTDVGEEKVGHAIFRGIVAVFAVLLLIGILRHPQAWLALLMP